MPIPPPSSTSNNTTEGRNAANAQQDLSTNSVTRSLTSNTYGTSLHAARTAREDAKLMARFIFYYGRWTAQKESSILETKMASTLRLRLKMMTIFALKESEDIGLELGTLGISFVNDAFTELLECRSFLQHSYAHAYFRFASLLGGENDSNREIEKLSLEHWQSKLEMILEQLSNAVVRSQSLYK